MDRGPVSQSEQPENRGIFTGRFPAPRTARSGDPGTVGADLLLSDGLRLLRGREQSRQEPLGSCADSWVRTIISSPSEARRVAIGWGIEQHSWTGFDSASIFLENYSIRGQGIIERRT